MTEEGRLTEGQLVDGDYMIHGWCSGWGCLRCGGDGAVRMPEVMGQLVQADHDKLMDDLEEEQ
jgi:hypothetical protein